MYGARQQGCHVVRAQARQRHQQRHQQPFAGPGQADRAFQAVQFQTESGRNYQPAGFGPVLAVRRAQCPVTGRDEPAQAQRI